MDTQSKVLILGAAGVAGLFIAGIVNGIIETNMSPVATIIIVVVAWMVTFFLVAGNQKKTD